MSTLLSLPRATAEFLQGAIEASVTLDTEGVELALARDDVYTWLPAVWIGNPGTTRTARTTSTVDLSTYPEEQYGLYARVTATPEVPVIYVGRVFLY